MNWRWFPGALALAIAASACSADPEEGELECAAGELVCGGGCADTSSDPAHCGACGNACGEGSRCIDSACALVCPSGQEACGGACVSLLTARDHCGACGQACENGAFCVDGACAATCPTGQEACGDGCFDLDTSSAHCGACGNACGAGEACVAGACTANCGEGQLDCGGVCTNPATDESNCGGCGTTCGADELCVDGDCQLFCASGTTDCAGTCRDTQRDASNCGGCGVTCGAGELCHDGACVLTCNGFASTPCGGACTNTDTDPQNCGGCGIACGAGEVCSGGRCAGSCTGAFAECEGSCTSLNNDPANCGTCGTGCDGAPNAYPVCVAGGCQGVCAADFGDCDADLGESGTNGCETDLLTSALHCGVCGAACTAPPNAAAVCNAGTCGMGACDEGFMNCDPHTFNGCETSVLDDPANCGGCGNVCLQDQVCQAGACVTPTSGPTCTPGTGGMVGTTYTRLPTSILTGSEHFVVPDHDPNGWVYVGGSSMLARTPKTGGVSQDVEVLAGLALGNMGYALVIDGLDIYTVEDASTRTDALLFRISRDGGTTWQIEDLAMFPTVPNGPLRSAVIDDGTMYLVTHSDQTEETQIWAVQLDAGVGRALAKLELSFGTGTFRNCTGLVIDSSSYYMFCESLVASPVGYSLLQIDRASGTITPVTDGLTGNTTIMALQGRDLDADGTVDHLYFNASATEEARWLCSPTNSPTTGQLVSFGTGTGNNGLGYDPVANVLWAFDDDTMELVRIQ